MLVGEDVVPLVFVVCTLSILIQELLDTLIVICTLRRPEGQMLYFDSVP